MVLTRPDDAERIYFIQRSAGSGLAPMDCFLTSRGIKTLAVRMLQHNANGLAVARHLDAHPKVRKVFYPGLASHPQHDLARRQQKGPGAMLAFDLGTEESWWRGIPDFVAGANDPRVHAQRNARTHRYHRQPRALVGRN